MEKRNPERRNAGRKVAKSEIWLAESWETPEPTRWRFHLRKGVKWSDGSAFTAADVFATYSALWDGKNANHKGNTGVFEYAGSFFGLLNPPPAPTPTK